MGYELRTEFLQSDFLHIVIMNQQSRKSKGTAPMPTPKRNKASSRDY